MPTATKRATRHTAAGPQAEGTQDAQEPTGGFRNDPTDPSAQPTPPPAEAPKRRALWAIAPDVRELADVLVAAGGEITEDDAGKAIDAWLSAVTDEHHDKLDAYAALIRHFDAEARVQAAEAAVLQEEAARFLARREAAEKEAARLRGRLIRHFQEIDVKKVDTGKNTFTLKLAGGNPALSKLVPEDAMPGELRCDTWAVTASGAAEAMVSERVDAALAELRALGIDVELSVGKKLDDKAARGALDMAIATRAARLQRIADLVDLGMSPEEAAAQEPASDTEEALRFVAYAPRKVSLVLK